MAKLYIFTNENGNVTVTTPAPQALEIMTHEEIMAKDCPSHAVMVDYDSLPWDDYDFFESWEMNSENGISINLTKAKEETRKRLRIERTPLLAAQDVLFQRALENGADTTAIVTEKNRLRDITLLVDDCTSLEQLRNLKC
jgi:hypothetical protein